MDRKSIIFLGLSVGGIIGGYAPLLFGQDSFSFSSIIFSAIGSLCGIWMAFRITE